MKLCDIYTSRKINKLWRCSWRNYTAFIIVAALCALLVSFCIPNVYIAQVKIVDEYQTTDLLVGLKGKNAFLRKLIANPQDEGTDNIYIYSLFLISDDFYHQIGETYLPDFKKSYRQYLQTHYRRPFWERPFHPTETDATIKDLIQENIKYTFNNKEATLDIQVQDQNRAVASQILQETLNLLRHNIEKFRTQRTIAARDAAIIKREKAFADYKKALSDYNTYADSHQGKSNPSITNKIASLQMDWQKKTALYQESVEDYVRTEYLIKKGNCSFAIVKCYNTPNNPYTPRPWVYVLVFCSIASLLYLWHYLYIRYWRKQTFSLRGLGNWFAPWIITIVIWSVILGLYHLQKSNLYPITNQFYYCLAIWIPIFCLCAFTTYILLPDKQSFVKGGIQFNKNVFNALFVLSLIITPLYIHKILQIVTMFSTEDMMTNIRTLAVYGEGYGFLGHSSIINQSLFVVALWAYPKVPKWQVVTLALACILNSLAIMEKGTIMFVFTSTIFLLFEKKVIKLYSIVFYGALLILFFYLFNLLRAGEDSDYQNEETLLDFFSMYALSPPVAFCQISTDVIPQFGANTFEAIYQYLVRFGMKGYVIKEKLQNFVWVPIPTNVYTIFQPFFIDFGYKGIAFFSGVYGVLCGLFYRLYRNGHGWGCCFYTYIVYVLVLQFYQDNLLLSLAFVVEFLIFIVLSTQKRISVIPL